MKFITQNKKNPETNIRYKLLPKPGNPIISKFEPQQY